MPSSNLAPVVCLLLLVLLVAARAEDYAYVTNNGTITITQYQGPGGDVEIPSSITGLPVTRIGEAAFASCFVTRITLPNTVAEIENDAFNGCWRLASVSLPDSLISVGNFAFAWCTNMPAIVVPNSVSSVGDCAFTRCFSLNMVSLGCSITNIGKDALYICPLLQAIQVDPLNAVYCSLEGVLFNKSKTELLQYPTGRAGSYSVPDSVISIAGDAFRDCTRLAGVMIPETTTSIGNGAFQYCRGLTEVAIPDSVMNIGENAFYFCDSLATLTIGNSVTRIGGQAFRVCFSLTRAFFRGSAPEAGPLVFEFADKATVYYLPGTIGWGTTFGGRPTAPWFLPYPLILEHGPGFGAQPTGFGFTMSWATNAQVIVEASTNLASPTWSALATNTLVEGSSYFSDPEWAKYDARVYRLRMR